MIYSMIGFRDVWADGRAVKTAARGFADKIRSRDHDNCVLVAVTLLRSETAEGREFHFAVACMETEGGRRFCESFSFWNERGGE